MMLSEHHRAAALSVPRETACRVLEMLEVSTLDHYWTLPDMLEKTGHDQADLIIALLRLKEIEAVEAVMGKPVKHLPSVYARVPKPVAPLVPDGTKRVTKLPSRAFLDIMSRIKHCYGNHRTTSGWASASRRADDLARSVCAGDTIGRRDGTQARGWVEVFTMNGTRTCALGM
jgi:hypothetical protein